MGLLLWKWCLFWVFFYIELLDPRIVSSFQIVLYSFCTLQLDVWSLHQRSSCDFRIFRYEVFVKHCGTCIHVSVVFPSRLPAGSSLCYATDTIK